MTAFDEARGTGPTPDQQQYLTFVLGAETYAIGILHIKEILECGPMTVVPMMPPYVRGVINLRGAVVPVIDLSVRFGRGATTLTRRSCVIIVEVGGATQQVIGIIVDAVNEVLEIPASDVEPVPSFGAKIRADFIAGMGRTADERFVIMLAIDSVLSLDELAAIEQVSAS